MFYINNRDFTQAFTGMIYKEETIQHISHDFIFRYQEDNKIAPNRTLANSDTVAKNCSSFMTSGSIRKPIGLGSYNEYIQSIGKFSVKNGAMNHLTNFISDPNPIIKAAISNTKETGW